MNDLLRTLGLLTVLPVVAPADDHAPPGRTMAYYPLIGAVLAWLVGQTDLARQAMLFAAAASLPLLWQGPVSWTIDVGHLWLQGADPLEHLTRWIDRARVIHLHDIAEQDHASVAHMLPAQINPVIDLLAARFSGVLTLEVFNAADFASSMAAVHASLGWLGLGEEKRWPQS